MKHFWIIGILSCLLFMASPSSASAQELFITGLDNGFAFSGQQCGSAGKNMSVTTFGKEFKVITFYYNNSTVTAVEDGTGKRSLLFTNGAPAVPATFNANFTKIGFASGAELKTNEYVVGFHDFTDDAQPELVIGIRQAGAKNMSIYVFGYIVNAWKCIGNMFLSGSNIRYCKAFRQTITIKDADSGALHTWTWHDNHFDYLSSDNS